MPWVPLSDTRAIVLLSLVRLCPDSDDIALVRSIARKASIRGARVATHALPYLEDHGLAEPTYPGSQWWRPTLAGRQRAVRLRFIERAMRDRYY